MQTVETLNEGLKRAYTLTITAQDIEGKALGASRTRSPAGRQLMANAL